MALLDFPHVCFVILFISLPKQNQTPAQIYKGKDMGPDSVGRAENQHPV